MLPLGRSHILHSEHSTLAHIKYDFIFQIRVNSTLLYNLLKEEAILGSFKCIIQLKTCTKGLVSFSGTGLSGLYKGPLGIKVCTTMSYELHIISLLSFIQNVCQFPIGSNFLAD